MLEAASAPPPALLDLLERRKARTVPLLQPESDGWPGDNRLTFFEERAEGA